MWLGLFQSTRTLSSSMELKKRLVTSSNIMVMQCFHCTLKLKLVAYTIKHSPHAPLSMLTPSLIVFISIVSLTIQAAPNTNSYSPIHSHLTQLPLPYSPIHTQTLITPDAQLPILRQFQINHLFNGFFLLSDRQAGRNKLKHKLPQYAMHHVYMVMCSSIQKKQQYTGI